MGALHKHLIYPTILRWRGEGAMYAELARLRGIQWDKPEVMRSRQLVRLEAALRYACEFTPYYSGYNFESSDVVNSVEALRSITFLTKADLQQNFDALRANPTPSRVHRKTTGGSTGQPVTVLKDARAIAMERAASWMAHGWFGIQIGDRGARFWGSPEAIGRRRLRFALADFAMNRVRMSAFGVTAERLAEYWMRCLVVRPQYLYGYVSMLEQFARFVREGGHNGKRLQLKCIVTTSEALGEPQRRLLEDTFGAPVQDEYGCGEVGPIAYECERGSLHVMSEHVFVELLDDDGREVVVGQEGAVVVTDLNNRAMPLIRYRLEDRAIRGNFCSCGRGFSVIQGIRGRRYDFVQTPDGRAYHGEYFMYVFEDLRDAGLAIGSFRIVQTKPESLWIDVQAPESAAERIRQAIIERVSVPLNMETTVHVMTQIPTSPSGKLRIIENRVASAASRNSVD